MSYRAGRSQGPRRGRAGSVVPALTTAALAAAVARASYAALKRRPPGGAGTWTRTNHRGEPVTLLEGPALAIAAIAAPALGSGLSIRVRAAMAARASAGPSSRVTGSPRWLVLVQVPAPPGGRCLSAA